MRKVEIKILTFSTISGLEYRINSIANDFPNLLEVVVTDMKPFSPEAKELFFDVHPSDVGWASVMFAYE